MRPKAILLLCCAFTLLLLSVAATAQCPKTCYYPPGSNYPSGCEEISYISNCDYQGTYCYFSFCRSLSSKLSCGDRLKLADFDKDAIRRFASPRPQGLAISFLPISTSPIQLDEISTGGIKDLLHSATLYNVGHKPVTYIRIGWIIANLKSPQTNFKVSATLTLKTPLEPNGQASISNHTITIENVSDGSGITFFVAEVGFTSGPPWRADVDELVRDAASEVHANKTNSEL